MCKHVQMCVLRHVRGHGKWDRQHWEIMRCDWSSMSTGFIILIKICIKTGFGTRDGFGDLVMHRERVRYPTTSVRRQLPPSMCSCVCLIKQNVGLLLGTNVPTLSGVHQLVMHVFNAVGFVILCSPFEYLVSFWVLGETMTGYT